MIAKLQVSGSEFNIVALETYLCQLADVTLGKATGSGTKMLLPVTVPFDCVQHTKYVADKYGCVARWVRGKVK